MFASGKVALKVQFNLRGALSSLAHNIKDRDPHFPLVRYFIMLNNKLSFLFYIFLKKNNIKYYCKKMTREREREREIIFNKTSHKNESFKHLVLH